MRWPPTLSREDITPQSPTDATARMLCITLQI